MPVQCLTQFEKEAIFEEWFYEDVSKAQLARDYCVSPDTINRVIKEMQEVETVEDLAVNLHYTIDDVEVDEDEETMTVSVTVDMPEYSFIMTPDSISITRIYGDEVDTVNVDQDHDRFEEVYQIIISDPRNQDGLEEAYEILNIKTHLENITEGRVTVYPEQNRITYTNKDGSVGQFSGRLVNRIIDGAKNNQNIDHLINFANKLADNPSNRAVNELYDFLEAADIQINEDGDVVCYKKVRSNFTDVFTGTFDNSVGQTVSVPRNMVDENSNQTCSYGLHVCSRSYLGSYPGEKVMQVLVDPADFVSIPNDYYSYNGDGQVKAKARVCRYYVNDDITNETIGY